MNPGTVDASGDAEAEIVSALLPLAGPKPAAAAREQIAAALRRLVWNSPHGDKRCNGHHTPVDPSHEHLPPRMRQTLQRLLAGDSEKQIAQHLGRSRHTVHVYVKAIYKRFGVCSRSELLARWILV